MMRRRILINRTSETVLRFLPPYIVEKEHIDQALAALDEILTEQLAHAAATPLPGGKKIGN
jgi:acetylornithine aminotransferase/acetylornithine/N-succinyldiaminopimelate aminotransferase